jgi:hypothetical protein
MEKCDLSTHGAKHGAKGVLDASDLDGDGTNNDAYETGDTVDLWVDGSGNNRNAYSYTNAGLTAPTNCTSPVLNKSKAFAGQDTVQFFNTTAGLGNAHNCLVSLPNSSTNETWSASGRTLLPTYTDAWFCVFMVLRVTDTGATIRCPLGQIYTASSTEACTGDGIRPYRSLTKSKSACGENW